MKKFLSIILTVIIVFSCAAAFGTQVSAATTYSITELEGSYIT